MKTNLKYNERLIKFAKHLQAIKNHPEFGLYKSASLVELEEKRNTSFMITYHEWVFEELPVVFSEWYFSETNGAPFCEGCMEEEGTLAAVIDFFDLRLTETCHLFDLEGFQDVKKYGGNYLTFQSDGPEIADNIYGLLTVRSLGKNIND